jgi:uncharacterized protein (DUF2252 family)
MTDQAPLTDQRGVMTVRTAGRYRLDAAAGRLRPADRAARGKAARAAVPRQSHAAFDPPAGRPDPVDLLEEQAKTRLPHLVPVRYGRMMVSPFTYFRGAALPMASDLADTPVTGLAVQACGDAHLSNFGIYASPERRLAFDINDFDETLPGPWEWDVKRLAASLEIAARGNGFTGKQRRAIVLAAAGQYREAMRGFAGMSNLDVWYSRGDVEQLRAQFEATLSSRQRKRLDRGMAKAMTRDNLQAFGKLTTVTDGRVRLLSDPPVLVPVDELGLGESDRSAVEAFLPAMIKGYGRTLDHNRRFLLDQYEFCDMAIKVVGVGSVGTRCWVVLMLGRDAADPLFLQVKEAQASVLSRFAGPSAHRNQGQRVVVGQRLMQATSDPFLGWQHADAGLLDNRSRDFYVRQLRDWKFSADIELMLPDDLRRYGALCGRTLARAHARSGDRIAIAAYLGSSHVFDQAIAQFAAAYADQTERDHKSLVDAVAAGRIAAERGV